MPKPDAALLDPARYPFSCRIEPRFGDLDLNMHINNAALVGIVCVNEGIPVEISAAFRESVKPWMLRE